MPAKPKSAYHHGDLKEALLAAADGLLRNQGVQGLSLRACARAAGVSHAAPKHHFNDVAELLAEVAARSFDALTAELATARQRAGDDPAERLVGVAKTYVGFARANPNHFRLMFRSDAMAADNPVLVAAATRTFAELTNSVTVQRGEPDVSPQTLTERVFERALQNDVLIAWSHIHGYAQLFLEGQFGGFAAAEGADAFVERTLEETGIRLSRLLSDGGA